MNDFLHIHYNDLVKHSSQDPSDENGFRSKYVSHPDMGCYEERTFSFADIHVNELKTAFHQNCKVRVENPQLPDFIHICMPVSGSVGTHFHGAKLFADLDPRRHHYLYVPDTEYELAIYKQTHIAHFEIALDYFSSLLCPSEKWSAALREKLFRGEVLYSGSGLSCYRTQKALEDVLNCQFSGAVRTLFFEAKVLEILTFQLEHYRQCCNTSSVKVRKKDRDVLEQLREYLISDFRKDHSLRSLSQYFGINEFKLKKQFKEQFGQTVFDFIFDLKMEHARQLLLDTGMFVKEVSREVGYSNANHFSTAFRKKFGINPAALKS